MYAMPSSETSVSTYKTTLRYNKENQYRHARRDNNVKSHNLTVVYRIFPQSLQKKILVDYLKAGNDIFQIISNS
jgi:hypothetical protein